MKKLMLIIVLSLVAHLSAGPLDDLQSARQNLVQGKQQVAQGKLDLEKGYFQIRKDVLSPLYAGIDAAEKPKQETQSQEAMIRDIYKQIAAYASGAILLGGIGVYGLAVLAYIGDIPDVVHSAIPAIESIQNTLRNVAAPITQANEQLHPQVGGFITAAQNGYASAKATFDANQAQFTKDFTNKVTQSMNVLAAVLTTAQGGMNPVTGAFRPETADAVRANISKAVAGLDMNFGDASAAVATKDPNAVAAADTIIKTLSQFNKQNWQTELDASKLVKPVYEKFNSAENGFDKAIAKIDTVINALKALQAAVSED